MRKTYRRPDGTEETVDATPEELAEYEKKLRGELKEQKKVPPVLHGSSDSHGQVDGIPLNDGDFDLIRGMRRLLADPNMFKVQPTPVVPLYPWMPDVFKYPGDLCQHCGRFGCLDTHVTCGSSRTITCDNTSDTFLKVVESMTDVQKARFVAAGSWYAGDQVLGYGFSILSPDHAIGKADASS